MFKIRTFFTQRCSHGTKAEEQAVMYVCVRSIGVASFYNILLDFRAAPTV